MLTYLKWIGIGFILGLFFILIGFIYLHQIVGMAFAQTDTIPDIGSSTEAIIYQDTPSQATVWSDTAPSLMDFVSKSGCNVTHTNLQGAGSGDNASSYVIATSTSTAGNFYILSVGNVKAGTADLPTISGSFTWTEIASKLETGIRKYEPETMIRNYELETQTKHQN